MPSWKVDLRNFPLSPSISRLQSQKFRPLTGLSRVSHPSTATTAIFHRPVTALFFLTFFSPAAALFSAGGFCGGFSRVRRFQHFQLKSRSRIGCFSWFCFEKFKFLSIFQFCRCLWGGFIKLESFSSFSWSPDQELGDFSIYASQIDNFRYFS